MDETDSADADVADPTDADTATDPPADANAPMVVQRRVAQFLHEAYGFAQTTEDGTFTAEQIEPTLAAVGIVNSVGPLISSVKRMGFLEIAGRTEGPRPVFIYRPVYGIAYQDKRTKAVVTVERPGPATVPDGDGDADPVASIPAFRSKEELVEELGTEQARLTTYRAEYVRAETARRERESLEREIAETELLLAAKRQRSTELFDIPFPTDDEPAIVAHVRDLEAVIERYGPTLRILLRQT